MILMQLEPKVIEIYGQEDVSNLEIADVIRFRTPGGTPLVAYNGQTGDREDTIMYFLEQSSERLATILNWRARRIDFLFGKRFGGEEEGILTPSHTRFEIYTPDHPEYEKSRDVLVRAGLDYIREDETE
jgi:hypothetical protein